MSRRPDLRALLPDPRLFQQPDIRRPIDAAPLSAGRPYRSLHNRPRLGWKKVTAFGLGIVVSAGVVEHNKMFQAFDTLCAKSSVCQAHTSAQPVPRLPGLPGPITSTAEFPSAKDPTTKVRGMAQYIINPKGITAAPPSKDKATAGSISIGVSLDLDATKYWQVSSSPNADTTLAPRITPGHYVGALVLNKIDSLKQSCIEDLSNIVTTAQAHAAALIQGKMVTPEGMIVTSEMLYGAENVYGLAPYTAQQDNLAKTNVDVHYYDSATKKNLTLSCFQK